MVAAQKKRKKRRAKILRSLKGVHLALVPAEDLDSLHKVKLVHKTRARLLIRRRTRRAARKGPRAVLNRKAARGI